MKAHFYAVRRCESGKVPFVSSASKSSLFITQESTCLASLCGGGGVLHFIGLLRDEPGARCATSCVYSANNRRARSRTEMKTGGRDASKRLSKKLS